MADLAVRAGTLDDAELAADIATAMRPDEPVDPVVERHFWVNHTPDEIIKSWIASLEGEPVAVVLTQRRAWPAEDESRAGFVDLGIRPESVTRARVRQLIDHGTDSLHRAGARVVEGYGREDEGWLREAFISCGFVEDHLSKAWELDLVGRSEDILRTARESRAVATALGVRCLTLADCAIPQKLQRLHELSELARLDVPRSLPALANSKEMFLARISTPGVGPERIWVAELDGELIGLSYLRYPPVRGHVWTGFTASHPAHRGKGIARAVKMETLVQAIDLGVPRVRTDNDERNAPMLHINQKLGYHSIPAWVSHLRRLG